MLVDLLGGVSVGQDVEQVGHGHEIESGEGDSLLVQKGVQGLLTDFELLLDQLEFLEHAVLRTEVQDVHDVDSALHDFLHVDIDLDELPRFVGQLFLDLLGADEQVLQERPGLLDVSQQLDDVVNGPQIGLPFLDDLLEVSDVLREQHVIDEHLVLFKGLEVLVVHLEGLDVGIFVLDQLERDVLPDADDLVEADLHL